MENQLLIQAKGRRKIRNEVNNMLNLNFFNRRPLFNFLFAARLFSTSLQYPVHDVENSVDHQKNPWYYIGDSDRSTLKHAGERGVAQTTLSETHGHLMIADIPELVAQWHPLLNAAEDPRKINVTSLDKYFWTCMACHSKAPVEEKVIEDNFKLLAKYGRPDLREYGKLFCTPCLDHVLVF
jgi:hypothetical protein